MIKIETVIERSYVEMMFNNLNSPAYADMVQDMALLANGVFSCTFKITDGNICDYVVTEKDNYVDSASSKVN